MNRSTAMRRRKKAIRKALQTLADRGKPRGSEFRHTIYSAEVSDQWTLCVPDTFVVRNISWCGADGPVPSDAHIELAPHANAPACLLAPASGFDPNGQGLNQFILTEGIRGPLMARVRSAQPTKLKMIFYGVEVRPARWPGIVNAMK